MAKSSYLQSLLTPPTRSAAVLRPPHQPLWGVPKVSQRSGLNDEFARDTAARIGEMDGASDEQMSHESVGWSKVRQESLSSRLTTERREGTDTAHVPVSPQLVRSDAVKAGAGGAMARLLAVSEPFAAASGESLRGMAMPSINAKAAALEGDERPLMQEASANASRLVEPLVETSAKYASSVNVEDGNRNIGSVLPIAERAYERQEQRAARKPTVHIESIDIHLVPPPAPPKKAARQQGPRVTTNLSRGFTSTFGFRQG